jgi:hypothetical protein
MLNQHNNRSAYGHFLKKYLLTVPLCPNKVRKMILVSITEVHEILLVFFSPLVKDKAIPLQALTGPEGSRRLRLPDFKTIGT